LRTLKKENHLTPKGVHGVQRVKHCIDFRISNAIWYAITSIKILSSVPKVPISRTLLRVQVYRSCIIIPTINKNVVCDQNGIHYVFSRTLLRKRLATSMGRLIKPLGKWERLNAYGNQTYKVTTCGLVSNSQIEQIPNLYIYED
jgi:hypothetical protein